MRLSFCFQKAGFGVTPPASPSSPASFKDENGFYHSNISHPPRLVSEGSDGGVDGFFKNNDQEFRLTEVSTIAPSDFGTPRSTLQRNGGSPRQSPTGVRVSGSPADKYKFESDTTDSAPLKRSRWRHLICILGLILLFLCVCAGIAVILAYKVFKVGSEYHYENAFIMRRTFSP